MKSRIQLVCALLLGMALAAQSVAAQQPSTTPGPAAPQAGAGEVRGIVTTDGDNAPVSGATITVRAARDSSLVTGAIAKDDGSFRIQGLRPGSYYLRITQLGFAPRTTPVFSISAASPLATISGIRLPRVAVALSTVEVGAERAAMAIEPDRNSYQVKQIAPAATNASEVLQATPSVDVDGDGKVSLRGNESVAIQINGRPAPIRGEQLGAYLKNLPANVLDRIEVITTPSARQDPEGMAGIINIVLKENVDLGLSGGFLTSASPAQRYNASGNLGYQAGRFTTFSSYGYMVGGHPVDAVTTRQRQDELARPVSFSEQLAATTMTSRGQNFSSTVDFKATKRDVISNILSLNRWRNGNATREAYVETDGDRVLLNEFGRSRGMDMLNTVVDYTLAFKRTIQPRKHELSAETRLNRSTEESGAEMWRFAADGSAPSDGERERVEAVTRQAIAQVDYLRTLGARTKIEAGFKGTGRWLSRDYEVTTDASAAGAWTTSDASNSFLFNERVHAGYAVLSQGVDKLELQGGLRAERSGREFTLAGASYPFTYNSLFPSAVASYKPSDGTQLKLAYSRRVRRPMTNELNPFPRFPMDAQNVFLGNPALRPEYTDALELQYQRTFTRGTLQISPFYRRTTDIIRVVFDTDTVVAGREVTAMSYANLASGRSLGGDLSVSYRPGPKLSLLSSVNIFRLSTDGGSASSLASGAVSWSAHINATTQLTRDYSIQAMYGYHAPTIAERGRFSSSQHTDFVFRRKLGEKSNLTLRVVDPFNTSGMRVVSDDGNVSQLTERQFHSRTVFMAYQRSFGKPPRVRQVTPDAGPEPQTGLVQQ